jgi:putative transposase
MPGVEHRQHKGLNNRVENSHQPTRVRERVMRRRFKSARRVQRLLEAFSHIDSHFRVRRHLLTAEHYREEMKLRFATLVEISCIQMAV